MSAAQIIRFPAFVIIWNKLQNQTTPAVHIKIACWCEQMWKEGNKQLLLMAFRACGKSTLVGLFCAWLLYSNPSLRIMVLAAEEMLARKMVRNVKRIIEKHPLTRDLRPNSPDQWASDRFTVKRDLELRDPSMLSRGVFSNITGTRADVIICDDVEVPNTCATVEKRKELRERLKEIEFILGANGTQFYVGTPHTYFTLYAEEPRAEIGEDIPFLHGFARLLIPIRDAHGESAWPERFDDQSIREMETRSGPAHFSSQMMLQPRNIADCHLNPANLCRYDDALEYKEIDRKPQLSLGNKRLVSGSAWWDPAFGNGADNSVCAIVFTDEDGHRYLHRMLYIPKRKGSEETDEATRQCLLIAQLLGECHITHIGIEINGLGRFLPGILRNVLRSKNLPVAIREISSRQPKNLRILEAFDAPMAANMLHVHRSVLHTPFATEMAEWSPTRQNGQDDGLDAAAGAISLEPLRLKQNKPLINNKNKWQGGTRTYFARTK